MKARVKETGDIIEVQSLYSVTYSRLDCNGKIVEEYDEDELDFNFDKDPLDQKTIFSFNNEYKLAKHPPQKDGYYMTIRCGIGGIYTKIDKYQDGKWLTQIMDDSKVIAYSKEYIFENIVDKWIRQKLEKYRIKNESTNTRNE